MNTPIDYSSRYSFGHFCCRVKQGKCLSEFLQKYTNSGTETIHLAGYNILVFKFVKISAGLPLLSIGAIRENFLGIFKSRMKGIDGRGGSADAIVNVAAVEFRFWAVVLTEKLMFDKTYKKIGVAGSHFSTHGHTLSLFVVVTTE